MEDVNPSCQWLYLEMDGIPSADGAGVCSYG